MKTLRQFLGVTGLMSLMLATLVLPFHLANAAPEQKTALPLPPISQYSVPTVTAAAPGTSPQKQFYLLVEKAILNVRYIIGAVAIAMIVYAGLRMIIAQGKEDELSKQRHNIMWAIAGLAIVGLSGEMVRIFSVSCDVKIPGQPCTPGGFLNDPNAILRSAVLFNQRTQFIITFIKYFIGSVAVLFIVRNGIRMIALGSQEDKMALDKKNLMYSILGLFLIIIADTAINNVFYKVDVSRYPTVGGLTPGIDPARAVSELVGITNFIVSIVSPVAILMLVIGAVMYITAAGHEDKQAKAKRVIVATIVGILIMYGAFAIVSTFVGGQFEGGGPQITQPTTK